MWCTANSNLSKGDSDETSKIGLKIVQNGFLSNKILHSFQGVSFHFILSIKVSLYAHSKRFFFYWKLLFMLGNARIFILTAMARYFIWHFCKECDDGWNNSCHKKPERIKHNCKKYFTILHLFCHICLKWFCIALVQFNAMQCNAI